MRVCLINLWDRGGMLNYTSQLANSLSRLPGIEPVSIVPRQVRRNQTKLFEPSVRLATVEVITDKSIQQMIQLPMQIFRMLRFPSVVTRLRPDIIHVTAAHVWLIYALPRLARHFPVVSTLHDIEPHPGLDRTLRKQWEIQTLVRYSTHVFVHGQALKDKLFQRYPKLASEKVHVIPHGDYAFFQRWASAVPEEPGTILFFGRIRDYKGLPLLCEAYTQVLQTVPESRLIIAGEGPLGELRPLLEAFPNCEIHNRYIPDEEVSHFFERASIIVCPYLEASQSGVIPVAYAFKKPVVATRVGCLPESVDDGLTGCLVPPGDPVAFARAIINLLQDSHRRQELGGNGYRKMVAEFGWDKISVITQRVYLDAIQGYHARAT